VLIILGAQSRLLIGEPKSVPDTAGAAAEGTDKKITPEPPKSTVRPASVSTVDTPAHATAAKSIRPMVHAKTVLPVKQTVASATLDVAVQHQFKDATLFIYVDGTLTLTRALHGGVQKKLILFNGVRGVESESLQVPEGTHVLRVRAVSADQATDLSRTVTAQFVGGDNKSLQVTFEKHNSLMKLTWQ
jgi:hypothetical protein